MKFKKLLKQILDESNVKNSEEWDMLSINNKVKILKLNEKLKKIKEFIELKEIISKYLKRRGVNISDMNNFSFLNYNPDTKNKILLNKINELETFIYKKLNLKLVKKTGYYGMPYYIELPEPKNWKMNINEEIKFKKVN